MSIEMIDVRVPRVLADLLVGTEEPPLRMVRPPAETVDEIERWLWLQAHEWSRAEPEYRQGAAERLKFARWRVDEGRVRGHGRFDEETV